MEARSHDVVGFLLPVSRSLLVYRHMPNLGKVGARKTLCSQRRNEAWISTNQRFTTRLRRRLPKLCVKSDMLIGMCIEVGLEAYRDALKPCIVIGCDEPRTVGMQCDRHQSGDDE